MKRVVCINDKNLPQGAIVVEGKEYIVENEYFNHLDQKVYILKDTPKTGITKWGLKWIGYDATRFREIEDYTTTYKNTYKEENFIFN